MPVGEGRNPTGMIPVLMGEEQGLDAVGLHPEDPKPRLQLLRTESVVDQQAR